MSIIRKSFVEYNHFCITLCWTVYGITVNHQSVLYIGWGIYAEVEHSCGQNNEFTLLITIVHLIGFNCNICITMHGKNNVKRLTKLILVYCWLHVSSFVKKTIIRKLKLRKKDNLNTTHYNGTFLGSWNADSIKIEINVWQTVCSFFFAVGFL